MSQLNLFASRTDWAARAESWMHANPHVYNLFVKFAHERARAGKPFGAKALAERVRWECSFAKNGEYKINNNYVAYIARRLVEDYPNLKPFIQFREVKF